MCSIVSRFNLPRLMFRLGDGLHDIKGSSSLCFYLISQR